MQAPELTNTQALINRYYTEEKTKKAQALTRATLNLQLDANDLAMLSTIAKRFGKSRDDLAKDVLSNALIDLLTQLEPGERKLIARDADEMGNSMSREIAEENGLKEVEHKPNVWTGHERNIAKIEKKRAKEIEDALKAEKLAKKTANIKEAVSTESTSESTPEAESNTTDAMVDEESEMTDIETESQLSELETEESETENTDTEATDEEAELDSMEAEDTSDTANEEQAPTFA
ncbi:MAG: hypothetical protein V7765_05375 [Oleispira sp.]